MSLVLTTLNGSTTETSVIRLQASYALRVRLRGTWSATVVLQTRPNSAVSWRTAATFTSNTVSIYRTLGECDVRLFVQSYTSGNVSAQLIDFENTVRFNNPDWEDMRFPASALNPTGAVADPSRDSVETSWPSTLLFSGTADNIVAGGAQLPHSTNMDSVLKPHLHWSRTAANTNGITWEFYYRWWVIGTAADAWQGPFSATTTTPDDGIVDAEIISEFPDISLSGVAVSANLAWRIYRRGSSDASSDTARLIEFDIHYQNDSNGSGGEFIK